MRRDRSIRRALVAACALALGAPGGAAPVGPALDRPAVEARRPAQTLTLGAALAGRRVVTVGERGIVLLSDDGGTGWRQAAVPVSQTLTAVRFVDAAHGWAVGHGGVVLATDDGGATWAVRLDGRRAAALALEAAERAAEQGGDARAVKDARRLVADGADKPFLDLHFFDARHGIVVGAYDLAFATDDGGASWRSLMPAIDNPKALHLYALRARGDLLLLAGEQGFLARSDDRGRHWRRLETPYKGSFFTAEIAGDDGHELVVAGLRGNVWRSTDGGLAWARVETPSPASITGSARAGRAGTVVLATQAGGLLLLRGDRIVPLPGPALPPLNGVLGLGDGGLLALGVAGPVRLPGAMP